jgi:phosphatidate phosphatase APP1
MNGGRSALSRWPRFPGLRRLAARLRDPVIILSYFGYGTPEKLFLCGRVLQDEGFRPVKESERRWRNLVAFVKRMESDEVPGARVRAIHRDGSMEVASDSEGYFSIELATSSLEPGWHEIQLELRDYPVASSGKVLVPPPDAEFGVISDIDDTIIQSNVMRKLRMIVTLALSNAHTRKPFLGVAAFYRALHRGRNPFFYVSKSPHNLYVPLLEFLQRQQLPAGPLLLRDFGVRMKKNHKAAAIERVLATYPALRFILVGDSGEEDPEIYSAILARFPERIRVIYIRSVDPSPARLKAIAQLAARAAPTGCQLVLAPDSEFAAAHAAAEGLIDARALGLVRADKLTDRSTASPGSRPLRPG